MNFEDTVGRFLSQEVQRGTIDGYLAELARSDARTTLNQLQVEIDRKHAELGQLQEQHARIQEDLHRLRLARVTHLETFAPVIFRHFWTVVSPDEFAIMSGRLDAPAIASPYLEPGGDTVRFMKGRFRALDAIDREQVMEFCRGLTHRLQVRAEMREFF